MPNLFSLRRGNRFCRALFSTVLVCFHHDSLLVMWTPRNPLNPLHYSPVDVNGGLFGPPFPVLHDQLICLVHTEGEVVVLAPHCQFSDLIPIVRLTVVCDQAYHCCVVSKLNDGVGVVFGHAVVGEQGVQEWTKYTPLRGPSVKDQRDRCVVAYSYHLGVARQDVQNSVAEGGV